MAVDCTLTFPPSRPPSGGLVAVLRRWYRRARERRALAELDERLLRDCGFSREQARREAGKPFWRA